MTASCTAWSSTMARVEGPPAVPRKPSPASSRTTETGTCTAAANAAVTRPASTVIPVTRHDCRPEVRAHARRTPRQGPARSRTTGAGARESRLPAHTSSTAAARPPPTATRTAGRSPAAVAAQVASTTTPTTITPARSSSTVMSTRAPSRAGIRPRTASQASSSPARSPRTASPTVCTISPVRVVEANAEKTSVTSRRTASRSVGARREVPATPRESRSEGTSRAARTSSAIPTVARGLRRIVCRDPPKMSPRPRGRRGTTPGRCRRVSSSGVSRCQGSGPSAAGGVPGGTGAGTEGGDPGGGIPSGTCGCVIPRVLLRCGRPHPPGRAGRGRGVRPPWR
ncbi:hypothetical protein [Ornithinimicrobium kibberense]|uniref:hypothetical protein n=1 Tax=Ornithinimicrobium kibberense TaxID=282060 RepID=UPI0036206AE8